MSDASKAEIQFSKDVPDDIQDDIMQMMCEAAHGLGHDDVCILETDPIDAINVRVSGIVTINGDEFTFILEDGNRNGTVLHEWNSDVEFEYHKPTRWTLAPLGHIVSDHIVSGRAKLLLDKWDGMVSAQSDLADLAAKYTYDKHFAPGGKTETYWRGKAEAKGFQITSQEGADGIRTKLEAAQAAA